MHTSEMSSLHVPLVFWFAAKLAVKSSTFTTVPEQRELYSWSTPEIGQLWMGLYPEVPPGINMASNAAVL